MKNWTTAIFLKKLDDSYFLKKLDDNEIKNCWTTVTYKGVVIMYVRYVTYPMKDNFGVIFIVILGQPKLESIWQP